jgi:hypothetical protein
MVMNATPNVRLEFVGAEALARALADTRAPHLPQSLLSDHYAVGNTALHKTLNAKITRLMTALKPHLHPDRVTWAGARADVLALDMAFTEHPTQPFDLAWVEIQAFTSMLPTFHAMHLAQRQAHNMDVHLLPHDPLPRNVGWVDHTRQWLAPHAETVLIEDRPRDGLGWPDFDGARYWWNVDVYDWRDVIVDDGYLRSPDGSKRYTHVWNRLILSDLSMADRQLAEGKMRAAHRLNWHSHPAWYDGVHKGSLADLSLAAHEACYWVEDEAQRFPSWANPERWVAKSVGGHSGAGLLLNPTVAQLSALPTPRQWIVQNKFRQVSVGKHPITDQPLFGEVRCLLALQDGKAPWVMAWIFRCSTNGIATMSGRRTLPGEGMTLLYFDTSDSSFSSLRGSFPKARTTD